MATILPLIATYIKSFFWRPSPARIESFPEEDCASLAGYLLCRPGDQLKDNRYTLVSKLGWGQYSTVWLAEDALTPDDPVAIKIGNVVATRANKDGLSLEIDALKKLSKPPFERLMTHVLMRDHFIHNGPSGQHLCIVTNLAAQTLADYIGTCKDGLMPPLIVKRLAWQLLDALKIIHDRDVIHADIKQSNIYFATDQDARMKALKQPAEWYEPREGAHGGTVYPLVKSKPALMPWRGDDDAYTSELYVFMMGDFGSAQLVNRSRSVSLFQPLALRAPEVILGAEFTTAADIWNVGCLIFELLTGQWLFDPVADPAGAWMIEEDHLTQMVSLTQAGFPAGFLETCANRATYFNAKGDLKNPTPYQSGSIRDALANYEVLSPRDLERCVDLIEQCLRLDPSQRPTAEALWSHPFLAGANCCCDDDGHDHD